MPALDIVLRRFIFRLQSWDRSYAVIPGVWGQSPHSNVLLFLVFNLPVSVACGLASELQIGIKLRASLELTSIS